MPPTCVRHSMGSTINHLGGAWSGFSRTKFFFSGEPLIKIFFSRRASDQIVFFFAKWLIFFFFFFFYNSANLRENEVRVKLSLLQVF